MIRNLNLLHSLHRVRLQYYGEDKRRRRDGVGMHLQGVRSGGVMESKDRQTCHVSEYDMLETP